MTFSTAVFMDPQREAETILATVLGVVDAQRPGPGAGTVPAAPLAVPAGLDEDDQPEAGAAVTAGAHDGVAGDHVADDGGAPDDGAPGRLH